ncbi:MAG: ORF6N domain-containing protein [bacterium]
MIIAVYRARGDFMRNGLVPNEMIERRIYLIRGQKVMIDHDLASLYRVPTKVFNQAVRRNIRRFPDDFMFQLTPEETIVLRSHFVTSKRGGRRYSFKKN